MRAIPAMAAALAVAALVPVRPRADSLTATYGEDDDAVESEHLVSVAREGRRARFTVRRTLRNRGRYPEEATLHIQLPSGGVARSLKARLGGRWFAGELLPAEKASEQYDRLSTGGRPGRRGPALLAWNDVGEVELRVFPVPPGGEVAVEYAVDAPLCYRAGWLFTDYPAEAAGMRRPALAAPGAQVETEPALRVRLGVDPDDELCPGLAAVPDEPRTRISYPAAPAGPLQARFAQVAVDAGHHLVRLEIDVPPIIEPAPRGARVVMVIDASRSQGRQGIDAQLALARGFVHHLPDAAVEVVLYSRGAERLFGAFVPASRLAAALERVRPSRLEPANGSDADAGLALAELALRRRGGPARVVLFTDDRLRTAFDAGVAAAAAGRLPPDAVLHVIEVHPGAATGASWERDDEHRLAGLARVRGGVAAQMSGNPAGSADAAEVMLGLVRPLVIEQIEVAGAGELELDLPDELGGGSGWRAMRLEEAPAVWTLRGKLWSRELVIPLRSSPGGEDELTALAFGNPLADNLPEAGGAALAMRAGVVSRWTSLLARDRAAPPVGLDPGWGLGLTGGGTCGCRSYSTSSNCGLYGTIGHGSGTGTFREPPDREGMLAGMLRDRAAACAAGLDRISVVVEATGDEVVDVSVAGAPPAASACIAELAWALDLPPAYFDLDTRYQVSFQ